MIRDLLETYVVIGPDQAAVPVDVTPTVWQELDQRFDGFKGRILVARFHFDGNWPTWEMHPQGRSHVDGLHYTGRGHGEQAPMRSN